MVIDDFVHGRKHNEIWIINECTVRTINDVMK